MRIAFVAIVVVVLGAVQLASDRLLRDYAAAQSFPRVVPALPFAPPFARDVQAGVAIDERDEAKAQALIATLPSGAVRSDLEGRLLAARGEHREAAREFVAAGDFVRVSDAIGVLAARGDTATAVQMQQELVERLRALGDQEELARQEWRLGQLDAQDGRHGAALAEYRAALQLFPLSETYLLAAGTESLRQGALAEARSYFEKVVELDPGSLDGHIGVGRVAARQGDTATAQREAAFVRARDPHYERLPWLQDELKHPAR